MPIYEYICSKCNRVTEKLQRFSDPPLKACPHCKGKVKKQVSNSSFVLKGGGWYKDGYGSTSAASAAKSTKETANKGDAPSNGGSKGDETKPENKKKEKAAA